MTLDLPRKFQHIFRTPARYRVWYGGRGSAKSHSIARALLVLGMQKQKRILCAREFQSTIADSSHRLLADLINEYKLNYFYDITKAEIRGRNGTIFLFRGIKIDPNGIKSLEGVDIAWVEEAQSISNDSLDILLPTIRKPGAEVWFSFNPFKKTDPVYERFVVTRPDNAIVEEVNYADNPWFPDVLRTEMEWDKKTNPDKYDWVWLGKPRGISAAQVFRGKYDVVEFDTPDSARHFMGADWGFATDPSTLIRCHIQDRNLYIDHEAWGFGVELDALPAMFETVPGSKRWTIYADSARPETISYMQRHGYPNTKSVKKWPGSVEDGIEYIKSYDRIIIHPRCKNIILEMELYQYKQDRITGEVIPTLEDKHNHGIDSLRYSLADYIRSKGASVPSFNLRAVAGI